MEEDLFTEYEESYHDFFIKDSSETCDVEEETREEIQSNAFYNKSDAQTKIEKVIDPEDF